MDPTSTYPSFGPRRPSRARPPRVDPRPASPARLAVAALALWLISALIPFLHLLAPVAIALLLVAGVGYLIRPRSRSMYWRGRQIDLGDEPGPAQRVYRMIFRG